MSRSFWIFRALLPLSLVFSACRPAATSLPATSTPTSVPPSPSATAQATSRPNETTGSSVNLLSYLVWFGSEEIGLYGSQYRKVVPIVHSRPLDAHIGADHIGKHLNH